MSTLRAYLGTAGLLDVGLQFYTQNTAEGARITSSIVDEGAGWYSRSGLTLVGDHVRWDSTGTPDAAAREDLAVRISIQNLDVPVSSRLAAGSYVVPDTRQAAAAAKNTAHLPEMIENVNGWRFRKHALTQSPSAATPSDIAKAVLTSKRNGFMTVEETLSYIAAKPPNR